MNTAIFFIFIFGMNRLFVKKLLLFPVFFLVLASCFQESPKEQNKETSSTTEKAVVQDSLKEKGIFISAELQQALGSALKRAIEDSGVSYALNYCNIHAYPLTDSVSKIHHASVRRVSHKARNPLNAASADELAVMEEFKAALVNGTSAQPKIIERESGYAFFAPILIQSPLCLKCHGALETEIAPEDFIVINMLYPNDKATGFQLNELRGMWRIDFPKQGVAL